MSVINLSKIFHDHVLEQRREWAHDRSTTVGASEVFACLRKAWFEKMGADQGYEPDPDYVESWGATERGNIIENHFLVPAFRNHLPKGLTVAYEGDAQETIIKGRSSATPDSVISGFPPGKPLTIETVDKRIVIENPGTHVGFEFKTIHPNIEVKDAKPIHAGQAVVQAGLLREVKGIDISHVVILYVNASHLDDIDFFVVEFDEEKYEYSKKRAQQVFDTTDPSSIRAEGKLTNHCQYCSWKLACGEAIVQGIPSESGMIGHNSMHFSDFEKSVDDYLHWKKVEEDAVGHKKEAQETLKELLRDSGMRSAKSEEWSVSWSSVSGRKTLDTKAMAEDGIDLEKYQRVGAAYDRLMVKRQEPKNDG